MKRSGLPKVGEDVRSFKEIALCLHQQLEYLMNTAN